MEKIFSFIFGFVFTLCSMTVFFYPHKISKILSFSVVENFNESFVISGNLYNESLALKLHDEVRILCWVMTNPDNHQTKAKFVKETWGSRCNKLLFMSTKTDPELGTIALPVKEGRATLWDKTKFAFQYVYKNHFNDADWFLKADDDNYMIIENIRYMLYQYHPQTALYFGHRFSIENEVASYMSGGGYILSKKALEKFATKLIQNATICRSLESGDEDFELGRCLHHSAIAVDDRDDKLGKRFFPTGVTEHLKKKKDPDYWYDQSQYYDVAQGSLSCCSEYPAAFHYVSPQEMFMIEYLTRHVHPYGFDKSSIEKLPRKLKLEEIIYKSDVVSNSTNYRKHEIYHDLEESEKYRKKRRNANLQENF